MILQLTDGYYLYFNHLSRMLQYAFENIEKPNKKLIIKVIVQKEELIEKIKDHSFHCAVVDMIRPEINYDGNDALDIIKENSVNFI
ncbi:hypothetical protein APF79_14015 [bacterium BRH_c32]|nr:MAG: hypothetical protein APF79_14015 [bacterium BRH_c32]